MTPLRIVIPASPDPIYDNEWFLTVEDHPEDDCPDDEPLPPFRIRLHEDDPESTVCGIEVDMRNVGEPWEGWYCRIWTNVVDEEICLHHDGIAGMITMLVAYAFKVGIELPDTLLNLEKKAPR